MPWSFIPSLGVALTLWRWFVLILALINRLPSTERALPDSTVPGGKCW